MGRRILAKGRGDFHHAERSRNAAAANCLDEGACLEMTISLDEIIADNAKTETNGAPRISEEDLALQFADTHAAHARYVALWNKWLIWDGVRWAKEKLDVGHVRSAVSVLIFHTVEDDGERLWLLALAVPLVVFRKQSELAGDGRTVVARSYELLEAEFVKVGGEILKEVALEWVVAVAVNDLATECVGVELEVRLDLFLNVNVLSVELVLLRRLRGVQGSFHRHIFRFRRRGRRKARPSELFACVFPRCRLRHGLSVIHLGSMLTKNRTPRTGAGICRCLLSASSSHDH